MIAPLAPIIHTCSQRCWPQQDNQEDRSLGWWWEKVGSAQPLQQHAHLFCLCSDVVGSRLLAEGDGGATSTSRRDREGRRRQKGGDRRSQKAEKKRQGGGWNCGSDRWFGFNNEALIHS